jgi:hypothetical protein
LFKNLSVDMKDVKPSSLLKDRTRQVVGNPDFSSKDVASQTPAVAEVSSSIGPSMNHAELQHEISSTSRATSLPTMLSQVGAMHLQDVLIFAFFYVFHLECLYFAVWSTYSPTSEQHGRR